MTDRIMIAGTASGCGKTMVTTGLLQCLLDRGLKPASFKCGPDYIDPMYHSRVLGTKSGNLDPFFYTPEQLWRILESGSRGSSPAVLEGVMGYYDGIGFTSDGGSADVAETLQTPVILVVDCRGMAASIRAVLHGYLTYRVPSMIRGVIFNRLPEKLALRAADAAREYGLRPLGYLPVRPELSVPDRHLGLVTPEEIRLHREILRTIAAAIEETVDVEGILELAAEAGSPDPFPGEPAEADRISDPAGQPVGTADAPGDPDQMTGASGGIGRITGGSGQTVRMTHDPEWHVRPEIAGSEDESGASEERVPFFENRRVGRWTGQSAENRNEPRPVESPVRIAFAQDEAFCFTYRESLEILEDSGCLLVPFSPLRDRSLPEDTWGVLLSGGYPELHAGRLSRNTELRTDLKKRLEDGMPCIAECGGFLYLHDILCDADGTDYPVAGYFPGTRAHRHRLDRFGYLEMTARTDGLLCPAGTTFRAHEFHYWDSNRPGEDFTAIRADGSRTWLCGYHTETLYAGFPHLALGAWPEAVHRFREACAAFRRRKRIERHDL